MASNGAILVSELDFENLRENLKQFLKSKTYFTDYNFDGSALSILLDVLAHDTYNKTFYLNQIYSEAFLDSSQTRGAAVSRAKELDYTPRSARASIASLVVSISPPGDPSFITIPKGTRFRGLLNGNRYIYSTRESITVTSNNGFFETTIPIYEGDPTTQRHLVDTYEGTLAIQINNANVDTNTIVVTIRQSVSATATETWLKGTDILSVTGESKVWYLQENLNGLYEIIFGDGILGLKPSPGNVIEISYNVTNGPDANGIRTFSIIDPIANTGNYVITTESPSSGGQVAEDINSIKYNAPRYYTQQNRAVTSLDYKQHVISNFNDIQAISVWGGEENDIPIYGRVFLSVKPFEGFTITDARKDDIVKSLEEVNVFSIDPLFVDPTFVYIIPNIDVRYNPSLTISTASEILQKVQSTITAFESNNLGVFERKFYYSRFVTSIDTADTSIVSNDISIKFQKRFAPIINAAHSYQFNFHQAFYHPFDGHASVLSSTGFTIPDSSKVVFLDDDGFGNVQVYYINNQQRVYINRRAGTIDYLSGSIILNKFAPSSVQLSTGEIQITVTPNSKNISPVRNEILLITQSFIRIYNDITGDLIVSGTTSTAGDTETIFEQPFAGTTIT